MFFAAVFINSLFIVFFCFGLLIVFLLMFLFSLEKQILISMRMSEYIKIKLKKKEKG